MNAVIQPTQRRLRAWRGIGPSGWLALAVVGLFFMLALGVWLGWWARDWFELTGPMWAAPSAEHWLGTNRLGQDIFARAVAATATAFEIALPVALISTLLGAVAGGVAGYFNQRWPDEFLLWLMGTLDAIPFYLLVVALAFALQGHAWTMHLAMIGVFWTTTARLVRAETQRIRKLPYIEAARVSGLPPARIIRRHIIPNTAPILLVQASLVFVAAIKVEVLLSFLGIGSQASISWGLMIAEGAQEILLGHYWNFIAASVFLFVLVMAFNLLGDQVQDALDPRLPEARAQRYV